MLLLYSPHLTVAGREIGCWPWDVCAGMVIAHEAGGLVTGSHAYYDAVIGSPSFGEPTEEILTGRKYLVIRAVGDSEVRLSIIALALT
jgi:myo-inositol-1(or 4)-monophosphatase